MIEKQMSDFLFGEIHTVLKDATPEVQQRASRYLTQLKTVVDAALTQPTQTRGRRGNN